MTVLQHSKMFVLVAVAILEVYCMASADMQWTFYLGERIVAHGSLAYHLAPIIDMISLVVLLTTTQSHDG